MRRARTSPGTAAGLAGERGSAVVEFTFLALLLMLPVVYFVVTMAQLQGGSFAVVGAADQAAKVYVSEGPLEDRTTAAGQAVAAALQDYGFAPGQATMDVVCIPDDCAAGGTAVTVTVHLAVPLPMVPFGDALRLEAASLSSSATQIAGRFP